MSDPAETAPNYNRIARAITFLSEHYAEQPSLERAAREAGISPFHFQRVFTRHVGVSPKSFIAHLTLDRAKETLASGASVLEASFASGLSSPSRLHDLCVKIEAMTPGDYARGGAGLEIAYGFHESPFGNALVMATSKGLCGLAFGGEDEETQMLSDLRQRWPKASYHKDNAATGALAERILARAGDIGLHLIGTPWQIKVWQALLAIPEGQVTSYRAIAESVCTPKASRAVGAAVGRNPISLLIPCHRVLGKSGALTGYHWGLTRKRAMLALEAARQTENQSAENQRESTSVIA